MGGDLRRTGVCPARAAFLMMFRFPLSRYPDVRAMGVHEGYLKARFRIRCSSPWGYNPISAQREKGRKRSVS